MEELRDIKGFVEVPDESFFYFILTVVAVVWVLALLVGFYVWWRKPKRRSRKRSPEVVAKEALAQIDFSNTKEAVYTFCEHAQVLSPQHPRLLALLPKLDDYKFRKEVPTLSKDDEDQMRSIIKEIS